MAFVTAITCKKCTKTRIEVVDGSGICIACQVEEADQKRRVYLAGLKGLTVEERLSRIEAVLYDLNAETRIKNLESSRGKF